MDSPSAMAARQGCASAQVPSCSRSVQLRHNSPSSPTWLHDSSCLQSLDRIKSWGTALSTTSFTMQCSGLPTPLYSTLSPRARALQAFSMANGSNNSTSHVYGNLTLVGAPCPSTPALVTRAELQNNRQGCQLTAAGFDFQQSAHQPGFLDEEDSCLFNVLEGAAHKFPPVGPDHDQVEFMTTGLPLDCRHATLECSALGLAFPPTTLASPSLEGLTIPGTPTKAAARQWRETSPFHDPQPQEFVTQPLYLGVPPATPSQPLHRLARSSCCNASAHHPAPGPDPIDALLQALTPINTAPLQIRRGPPAAQPTDSLDDFKLFRRQPLTEHMTTCTLTSEQPGVAACKMYSWHGSDGMESPTTQQGCGSHLSTNPSWAPMPAVPLAPLPKAGCAIPQTPRIGEPCSVSTPRKATAAAPPAAPKKQALASCLPHPAASKRALWPCPPDAILDTLPAARHAAGVATSGMEAGFGHGLYPLATGSYAPAPPAHTVCYGTSPAAVAASAQRSNPSARSTLGNVFLSAATGMYPAEAAPSAVEVLPSMSAPVAAVKPDSKPPASLAHTATLGILDTVEFKPFSCSPLPNTNRDGDEGDSLALHSRDASTPQDNSLTKVMCLDGADDFTFAAAAFDSEHPLSLSPMRVGGELNTGPLCFDEELVGLFLEGLKLAEENASSTNTASPPLVSDVSTIAQSLEPSSSLCCSSRDTTFARSVPISEVALPSGKPAPITTTTVIMAPPYRLTKPAEFATCSMAKVPDTKPGTTETKHLKFWSRLRAQFTKTVGKAF